MPGIHWFIFGLCAVLAGCSPAISPALQQEPGAKVDFAELAAHPEKYQGQTKILGGEVMQVQPLGRGSILSVDQHQLDSHLFPGGSASGGTFLVESDEWLNPAIYQPKSKVTIAGVVSGQRNGMPVLKARQIHYWEGPSWEKWYYPVPPEWYDYDPNLEYWNTPPRFDPWRGGGRG